MPEISEGFEAKFTGEASSLLAALIDLDRRFGSTTIESQGLEASLLALDKGFDQAALGAQALSSKIALLNKSRSDAALTSQISGASKMADQIAEIEQALAMPRVKAVNPALAGFSERMKVAQAAATEFQVAEEGVEVATAGLGRGLLVGAGKVASFGLRLAYLLPGLGIAGLIGGVAAAFGALFNLLENSPVLTFTHETEAMAQGLSGVVHEMELLRQAAASAFSNVEDLRRSIAGLESAHLKHIGDELGASERDRQEEVRRANEEYHQERGKLIDAAVRRHQLEIEQKDIEARVAPERERLRLIEAQNALDNAGHYDYRGRWVPTPIKERIIPDEAKGLEDVPGMVEAIRAKEKKAELDLRLGLAEVDREQAWRAAELARLNQELPVSAQHVVDLKTKLDDLVNDPFGHDIEWRDLPAKSSGTNIHIDKIIVNETIKTDDPGQLAGAQLEGAYQGLLQRLHSHWGLANGR